MLQMKEISKDMGEFLLDEVSLDVDEGEYLVIIGPTGAGKTILLETLAGIYRPDAGRIVLNGDDITDIPPRERNICMVYQDYMLFPHLTVHDNIAFGLKTRKEPADTIEARVKESAGLFGIGHLLHRYPDTLSGGEQQRAAIARAMVMEPSVLLLDEPLSALDGQTRERLRAELKMMHSRYRTTVIHITHNFEEVFSLADRVAVMNHGKIIQIGEPDEVFRRPNSEFIANFVGVENLFRGQCCIEDHTAKVDVNGVPIITTACSRDGDTYVMIRPEDIMIAREKVASSARNMLQGRITEISNMGTLIRLRVEAGITFTVVLTRQGFTEMKLQAGDDVWLIFKASSVHAF